MLQLWEKKADSHYLISTSFKSCALPEGMGALVTVISFPQSYIVKLGQDILLRALKSGHFFQVMIGIDKTRSSGRVSPAV